MSKMAFMQFFQNFKSYLKFWLKNFLIFFFPILQHCMGQKLALSTYGPNT